MNKAVPQRNYLPKTCWRSWADTAGTVGQVAAQSWPNSTAHAGPVATLQGLRLDPCDEVQLRDRQCQASMAT